MHTPIKPQFCKHQHDTFIVGRNKDHICIQCKKISQKKWIEKNLKAHKKYTDNYYHNNKHTIKVRTKQYRQNNPDKVKTARWKNQNIINLDNSAFTLVDYDRLYQIQSGRCVICKKHQTELKRALDVDHDHKTGFVRGLLCHNCNQGLGNFKDNISNLKKSVNYMKNHMNGGSNNE